MRLYLEKLSTRFPGGKSPVFILAVSLLAYLGAHLFLESGLGICWFRAVTGINCPTCGLSRSFLALFRGRVFEAFLYNPFMLVFTLGVFLQLFSTVVFKRRLAINASPGQRQALLIAFLILFLLNWAWVIFFSPAL